MTAVFSHLASPSPTSPSNSPTTTLAYRHHSIDSHRDTHSKHLDTPPATCTMFRRVAAVVPQAGRLVATTARPTIASPVRAAAPATVAVNSRRQYHEKDE